MLKDLNGFSTPTPSDLMVKDKPSKVMQKNLLVQGIVPPSEIPSQRKIPQLKQELTVRPEGISDQVNAQETMRIAGVSPFKSPVLVAKYPPTKQSQETQDAPANEELTKQTEISPAKPEQLPAPLASDSPKDKQDKVKEEKLLVDGMPQTRHLTKLSAQVSQETSHKGESSARDHSIGYPAVY